MFVDDDASQILLVTRSTGKGYWGTPDRPETMFDDTKFWYQFQIDPLVKDEVASLLMEKMKVIDSHDYYSYELIKNFTASAQYKIILFSRKKSVDSESEDEIEQQLRFKIEQLVSLIR